jgi:hypothetical protein
MSILWLGYYLLISSVVLPLLSRHMGFGEGMFAVLLAFGFGIGGLVSEWRLLSRRQVIMSSALIVLCLAVGGAKIAVTYPSHALQEALSNFGAR